MDAAKGNNYFDEDEQKKILQIAFGKGVDQSVVRAVLGIVLRNRFVHIPSTSTSHEL